jgi:hypothetical protein
VGLGGHETLVEKAVKSIAESESTHSGQSEIEFQRLIQNQPNGKFWLRKRHLELRLDESRQKFSIQVQLIVGLEEVRKETIVSMGQN